MYQEIAANKRKTWFLLTIFSLVIMGFFLLFGVNAGLDASEAVLLGFLFSTGYSLVSYFISDKVALAASGAKKVNKKIAFELYTMVENLCIASGMPMPEIYVIDDESPNAFATGRDPEHAAIAVTTGLLRRLSKLELEGVLAHELSHIRNYDIRVMTIVVVLVGLIVLLSDIFLRFGFFRGSSRDNKQAGGALIIIGIVLAILSPLIAQLIKLAVSRTREYLADASGALLTRHPEGLASALEKISASATPLRRANHATAHLFISNPFGEKRSAFSGIFSTHPPIEERIKKLRTMGS